MSSRRAPKMSDSRNYYEILQVPKNASQDDVRKAYRIAAMKHHPDKGGHPEMLIELTNAYQVLSDPVKRAIYDKSGEDRHGEDRYRKYCSGEDRYSKDRSGEDRYSKDRSGEDRYSKDRYGEDRYSKDRYGEVRYSKDRYGEVRYSKDRYGEDRYSKDRYSDDQHCDYCYSEDQHRDDWYYLDVIHYLSVSLEELYKGTFKVVSFKRDRLCGKCKGTGKSKDLRYWCQKCKGDKVVEKQKTLLVKVNKGMRNRQRIIVAGQGHQAPKDTIAGDFVCVLEQKEHPKFKRKGDDLIFERTISSAEAHYGFKLVFTHLDGWTKFWVKCGPKGGSVDQFEVTINDAGMPMYLRPSVKGKLYVNFTVDYPPDRYY